MRALIGLLVLGGLFVMAAAWQDRTTDELRERRSRRYGVPRDARDAPVGWSELVLGRPSGADPLPLPEDPALDATLGAGAGVAPPVDEPGPPVPPDFAYEVQPNDVLGTVCQRYYGTAHPDLVQAVARYNDLASPDAIRSGATLYLPDRALLEPER